MNIRNLRRLTSNLTFILCTVITLSGCGGSSSGTSVPFSAMASPDGTGSVARFNAPANATIVGTNLYVTDLDNHTIRKIEMASGQVTTFAGNGTSGSADGTGAAARFNKPFGITTDGTHLFVADSGNHTIRKITISTGRVTTLAGTAGAAGSIDKRGLEARFNTPTGITSDDGNDLYVTDTGNNAIRKIGIASRIVTTLGVITDNNSNSFLFSAMTSASGSGSTAKFNRPYGLAVKGANLYVANTGNNAILKLALDSGMITPLAVGNRNNGSSSFLFSAMTSARWTGSSVGLNRPFGIATDGVNIFLADSANNIIRKLVLATDDVSILSGSPEMASGSVDGTGLAARFNYPVGIAIDSATNLYVTDSRNNTIRKVVIATGAVTTLAGKAP